MATRRTTPHVPGSGDVELQLGELTLTLKPTLQAGLGISRQCGGIRTAIDKVMLMDLDTIVAVIRLGIGPEEAKRIKNLERTIYDNGLFDTQGEVLARCIEFLSNLARGGRPADPTATDEEGAGADPTTEKQLN